MSLQYNLNLMADFLRMQYKNPKLKQYEIAKQLSYSSSTLQRYRTDIDVPSPYKIQSNNTNKRTKNVSNSNCDNNSHLKHDLKRPQMTSNDLETNTKSNKKIKIVLKDGFAQENNEINDQYSDDILDNNDI